MNNISELTIGLFGTCGDSKWREPFINYFEKNSISYFNPVVPEWKPEDAIIEANHLKNDKIILFPVTSETYGFGSLGEIGFSILKAIDLNQNRDIIVFIDPDLDDNLLRNELMAKDSTRARRLIISHLAELENDNVYCVSSLEQMLEVTKLLHESIILKNQAKQLIK